MYYGFIEKLENINPNRQLYKDIDDLFLSKVGPAREFVNSFIENDTELLYWYDMNERKFINMIPDYNSKIIMTYDFNIYAEDKLFHNLSTVNKITIPLNKWELICSMKINKGNYPSDIYCLIKNEEIDFSVWNESTDIYLNKSHNAYDLNFSFDIDNPTPTKLKIYIDNYLNVIIPSYKTIMINNYVKFPNYALYSIYEELNLSEVVVFNKHNKDDMRSFNKIKKVITNLSSSYLTSYDHRKMFDNGNMFNNIFNFINHRNMMNFIKPQLDFMASLKLENNQKNINDIHFQQVKDLQTQLEDAKKQIIKLEKEKEAIIKKNN